MTCLKCAGLMVREPVLDFFEACTLWRCIQCGLRLDWLMLKNRQAGHDGGDRRADMTGEGDPESMSEEDAESTHRRRMECKN